MQIMVKALMNAITLQLLMTEVYFIFLTNWEGEIPNCFWKLVAKYDGEENPTRYEISFILKFPSINSSAAFFSLVSLMYSTELRSVSAFTFL